MQYKLLQTLLIAGTLAYSSSIFANPRTPTTPCDLQCYNTWLETMKNTHCNESLGENDPCMKVMNAYDQCEYQCCEKKCNVNDQSCVEECKKNNLGSKHKPR